MSDTSNFALPTLPPAIRPLTTLQSRSLDARYPTSRQTLDNCITCNGAKTFQWFAPGSRTEVVTYDCPCRDQFLLSRWLWNSGIMKRYQRLGWADFTSLPDSTATQVAEYISQVERYSRAGLGLVLYGPRGTGKTLLSNLVLKEIISKGHDCYATTFPQMIDSFAEGWTSPEQKRWFNQRLRDARMLLIDDLGREHKGRERANSSVGETMLENVLRHRVASSLPTIVTSNQTPEELTVAYGGHTESLLSECSIQVLVPGADSRESIRSREAGYLGRGLDRPVVIS